MWELLSFLLIPIKIFIAVWIAWQIYGWVLGI